MILLDSATPGTTQDINAEENAAIHNVVTGLTNPNIHKCILRLFVTWDGTSRTRNLSVQIKDTGGEVYHEDFVQAVTHYASSDKTIFLVPILYDESNGLTIKVWSDNANDDNETVGYEMYSDDAEYFEDFRAAAGSPTANSRTERIKTTDDNVTTLIGRVTAALFSGITSLAEWLGAMAGSHTADTTALGEINATGPGTGSGTFDEAADSQEAIANGAAGGGATAQQVWEYGTRVLTAGTNIGTVTANIIQIDGLTTVDQSAVLKLKQLDVTNSAGTAVIMSGTGIGANGLSLVGGTAGAGLLATGGASSNAIKLAGTGAGSTLLMSSTANDVYVMEVTAADGPAIVVSGTTFGIDIDASAGSGVRVVGSSSDIIADLVGTVTAFTAQGQQNIAQTTERTAGVVYHVATKALGGAAGAAGTSWDAPELSPKTAIEAATAGDVVIIGPGTYGLGADTFVDGSFAASGFTLTKASAFGAVVAGDKHILSDNGSGEVASGVYTVASIAGAPNAITYTEDIRSGTDDPVTDVVWNDGDAGITAPDGVIVRGSGMDTTVIASSSVASSARVFTPGSRTTYSDFTINATDVPTSNVQSIPFGISAGSIVDTVCRRLKITGDTDGVWISGAGAKPIGIKFFDCVIDTKYDGVRVITVPGFTSTIDIDLTRTKIDAAGPSGTGEENSQAVSMTGAAAGATVQLIDCDVSATDGGTVATYGLVTTMGNIRMSGGALYARDDSNPSVTFDASQSGSGVIELIGVEYDRDNTSGTIVYSAGHERDLTLTLADTANMQPKLGTPAADVSADIAAVKTETAQIASDLPSTITKNTALADFPFFMVLAADHFTGATGKTVVAQRSIDGGAFGNCTNTPATEIANGIYKISLTAADLNGDTICLKFTNADCDSRILTIVTKPT